MPEDKRPMVLVRKDGTTSLSWGDNKPVTRQPSELEMADPQRRADEIRAQLQDRFPYLAQDIFAEAIVRYARAEARAQLLTDYANAIIEKHGVMAGVPKVKNIWAEIARAEANAAKFGQDCGLDPAGHAKLAKDLGWAKRLGQEAVSGLSEVGRALRANREIG